MKKALFIGLFAWLAVSCSNGADDVRPGAIAKNSVTIDGVAIDKTAEVYVLTGEMTISSTSDPVFLDDHATDIDKGSFTAGTSVTLKPFIMGKYEVTQELYEKVMNSQTAYALETTPSYCNGNNGTVLAPGETQGLRPVDRISWYDAVYFCNVLSKKSGYSEAYTITDIEVKSGHITSATVTVNSKADGYRLPTGAEWEFAARGGNPSKAEWNYMFSGSPTGKDGEDDIYYGSHENIGINPVGWYKKNLSDEDEGSHETGMKKANSLGIFDMTGNVWEWCSTEQYDTDHSCLGKLERGGGWQFDANFQYVTKMWGVKPGWYEYHDLGFRVVRSIK